MLSREKNQTEELMTQQTFSIMPVASSQMELSEAVQQQTKFSVAWL